MSDDMQFPYEVLVPASEQLLGHVNRYHAGQESYDELAEAMEISNQSILTSLNQFLPSVPISSRPDAAEKQRASINILAAALNDLTTAIPQILEYAACNNEEMYKYLLERLGRILSCERVAIEQYHYASIPAGPTDMPFVNAVYFAQKRFYAGEISKELYESVIDKILKKLQDATKEIEDHEGDEGEAKTELIYAYRRFIDALDMVKTYIDQGEAHASGLMKEVTEAAESTRDSIKVYTFHANTKGPTRMTQANLMISMGQYWQQGRMEPNVFLRALEIFAENLDRTWRQLQAISNLPNDASEQIAPYMETLREAYEEQFQAVELFRAGVAGNAEAVEAAVKVMISGAEKAADCRDAFQSMGENVGKVPCMRCGTYNVPGSRSCTQCGARLLGSEIVDAGGSSTISYQEEGGAVRQSVAFVVTPPLKEVFNAIDAVTEGRISKEEYAEALNKYRTFTAKTYDVDAIAQHMLEEVEDETGDLPERVQAVGNELYTAVNDINNALDILEQYVSDTNSQYIVDGVLALRDASASQQKVMAKIKAMVSGESEEENNGGMSGFDAIMVDDSDSGVGFVC